MEHLEAGDRLDDFLTDYPTVSRRQAVALLERATTMLVSGGRMKLLLDESVPRRLGAILPRIVHDADGSGHGMGGYREWSPAVPQPPPRASTPLSPWTGGIEHQQNVNDLPMPVVIMLAHRNRLTDLQPLVPYVISLLSDPLDNRIYRVPH